MNLKINNARLSYPNLFEAKSGPEGGEPKFNASFLLDKKHNAAEVRALKDAILATAKAEWGEQNVKFNDNGQLILKKQGGGGALLKMCLRDGGEKSETPGYGEGIMFFSASNKMQPACVDKNPSRALTKLDGRPYAGCYVNVSIRLWAQDNQFGKRVNAQLQAVQYVSDGEAFGEAPIDPTQVFGNIENVEPSSSGDTAPADDFDPEADSIPF